MRLPEAFKAYKAGKPVTMKVTAFYKDGSRTVTLSEEKVMLSSDEFNIFGNEPIKPKNFREHRLILLEMVAGWILFGADKYHIEFSA